MHPRRIRTVSRISIAAACIGLAGGFFAAASPASSARSPAGGAIDSLVGRPLIILVHGRGQLARDTAAVRREWVGALREGVSRLDRAPALRDDDVRLAWYADALDPLTVAGCDRRGVVGQTSVPADETASLRQLFAAAGLAITGALEMMDDRSRIEARALAGDLLFLGDGQRRCAAEQRLEATLADAAREKRPVVLVAYSFGSLLAYAVVHDSASSHGVRELVTMGSLLGAPGARLLLLGDTATRPVSPPGIRRWTNILDPRDGLAHPIPPARSADDSLRGNVLNVVTSAGASTGDPHDVLRYLRDTVAARAILDAWCRSYEPAAPTSAPAECPRD